MIRAASAGDAGARRTFTDRYLPIVRAYLKARWRGSPLIQELEDCVQEVFLTCFRQGGALENLQPGRGSGFRAYLFGLTRNVALHAETRRARDFARRGTTTFEPENVPAQESSLSRVFDREWARALLREAMQLQASQARARGPDGERRVELLRLRFQEGQPIREIARAWSVDAAKLHHDYAQARKEFLAALQEILGRHELCPPDELKQECKWIFSLLE